VRGRHVCGAFRDKRCYVLRPDRREPCSRCNGGLWFDARFIYSFSQRTFTFCISWDMLFWKKTVKTADKFHEWRGPAGLESGCILSDASGQIMRF
jgi:hypothetical protein